jgi:putative flavoprotein involved in K+ transport
MTTETVIVGAGQAGLSLSRYLSSMRHDHVVLERGKAGERWRSERWDSLRLLTPNWLNALDGSREHADRDGFLAGADFADYLARYARRFGAPVRSGVEVAGVETAGLGFRVKTDRGDWRARNVVLATGFSDVPRRPAAAAAAPRFVRQLDANQYREPSRLAPGGVLVVGAGPSGQQIALELRRAGRMVVLATGQHARLPRRYLGKDIWHWLDAIGDLDRTVDEFADSATALRTPTAALSGANGGEPIDLGVLHSHGIVLTGRLSGFDGARAVFADDLQTTVAHADFRLHGLLERIDEHVEASIGDVGVRDRIDDVLVPDGPHTLDLRLEGISTIVWATGYGRDYSRLHVPVLDEHGELDHDRGVTAVRGFYALGLKWQHRKTSHQIGGVGRDARFIAAQIASPTLVPAAARRRRGFRLAEAA